MKAELHHLRKRYRSTQVDRDSRLASLMEPKLSLFSEPLNPFRHSYYLPYLLSFPLLCLPYTELGS